MLAACTFKDIIIIITVVVVNTFISCCNKNISLFLSQGLPGPVGAPGPVGPRGEIVS